MVGSRFALLLLLSLTSNALAERVSENSDELDLGGESLSAMTADLEKSKLAMRRDQVPTDVVEAAKTMAPEKVLEHALDLVAKHAEEPLDAQSALEQHADLHQSVAEHLASVEGSKGADELAKAHHALIQRARATLGAQEMKSFDKVLKGKDKTTCACFAVRWRGHKLADLDEATKFDSSRNCYSSCPALCHYKKKFKFDPSEARKVGASGVQQAMTASKCEVKGRMECECLDASQTVDQVQKTCPGGCDISHNMHTYDEPGQCLRQCAPMCDQYDSSNVDWEGLCLDEWDNELEHFISHDGKMVSDSVDRLEDYEDNSWMWDD